MNALLFTAAQAALLAAFVAAAAVAGGALLRTALRHERAGPPAAGAFFLALGILLLATVGALLGVLGRFDATTVAVAGIAPIVAGAIVRARALPPALPRVGRHAALAALVLAPYAALAAYPAIAFDETMYHLPYARAFVESAALPFLPGLRFPIFPQLAEVVGASLLHFGGEAAAHLPALVATFTTALLLASWANRLDGGRSPFVGWLAAAFWLGNPLVTFLSGTLYVEPLLALFVTASCYAFWLWQRGGARSWLLLAAAFAGAAAATKYHGLYFVAAYGLATLLGARREEIRTLHSRLRDALLFGLFALAVMAPWYGRILYFTGNPVFPFLSGIFGANDTTPTHFRSLTLLPSFGDDFPAHLGAGLHRLLTLPWDLVAARERVGALPHVLTPLLLLMLLLAVGATAAAQRSRSRRAERTSATAPSSFLFVPAATTITFVLLTRFMPSDARYLFAVLPLSALFAARILARLLRSLPEGRRRAAAIACAVLVALPGWAFAVHRVARLGPPPTSAAAREAFLARVVPAYRAVRFVNARLRPGERVYGLYLESMRAHVRGEFEGDWFGPRRYGVLLARAQEPGALGATLRAWGIDYLLVHADFPALALAARDASSFERLYEDEAAVVFAVLDPNEER